MTATFGSIRNAASSKDWEVFTKMKIQNQLGYIKGITFAPFHRRGSLSTQTARDSFDYMMRHTAADFVITYL